jgi:PAS domain S-box-containing protein
MSYDRTVHEFSRPLNETILSQIPAAIVVIRASDQLIVFANDLALHVSGYSTSDFGKLSMWDLLVEEDSQHVVDEASKPHHKRATENADSSEGFARFRAKSGAESSVWYIIKDVEDSDGLVRFRLVLAFLDYDQHAYDENWRAYIASTLERGVRRSAGVIASELNNALAVLQIALLSKDPISDDSLTTALIPLKTIGERLHRFGSRLELDSDQQMLTDGADCNQLHPQVVADLLLPRVLIVDDDVQLLEALQELLFLNGVNAIKAVSTKLALEYAHLFLPKVALIDLHLGDEDGRDVARLLLESFPTMTIIFMTGYANSMRAVENEGKYTLLKKPFPIDTLISLITNKVLV